MPADAGVDDRDAGGLEPLGERHHFLPLGALIDQVEHGQPKHDEEVGPAETQARRSEVEI